MVALRTVAALQLHGQVHTSPGPSIPKPCTLRAELVPSGDRAIP